MSKRFIIRDSSSSSSSRPHKRQRVAEFGASTPDDVLLSTPGAVAPRDLALAHTSTSTRSLSKARTVSSLGLLAARAFALAFPRLYANEAQVEQTRLDLRALPDAVANRLFEVMKELIPGFLPGAVVASYFLRGPNITLADTLTQVNRHTIQSIGRVDGETIHSLVLNGFKDIQDKVFAEVIPRLTSLRHLSLKGCTKAGELTATAVANHCPSLVYFNMNHTAITSAGVSSVLTTCEDLEVLKIAGMQKVKQTFLASLASQTTSSGAPIGSKLRSLKLRLVQTPNLPLDALLSHLTSLETLDASWTDTPALPFYALVSAEDTYARSLTKLSLISTPIKPAALPNFLLAFPALHTLHLGAIGGSDFPTLTNADLNSLTDVLVSLNELRTLNLAGNRKLGLGGSQKELKRFIERVGRRCETLSLASIPNLKSGALEGLMPLLDEDADEDDHGRSEPSRLKFLDLSNTAVDDGCVPFLASCKNLVRLNLEATKMSTEGVLEIIDGCVRLEEIALEKCRSVDRGDRRRIFEVWDESRGKEDDD